MEKNLVYLIYGKTQIGKTTLCNDLAKKLKEKGEKVIILSVFNELEEYLKEEKTVSKHILVDDLEGGGDIFEIMKNHAKENCFIEFYIKEKINKENVSENSSFILEFVNSCVTVNEKSNLEVIKNFPI